MMPTESLKQEHQIIAEMIGRQGFPEFLAKYSIHEGLVNEDVLQDIDKLSEVYELYEKKEELSEKITTLLSGFVEEPLSIKLGKKYSKAKEVDEGLEKMAIEDKDKFDEYCHISDKHSKLIEKKRTLDAELTALGGVEKVKTDYEAKSKIKVGWISKLFKTEKARDVAEAKSKMKVIGDTEKTTKKIDKSEIGLLKEITQTKEIRNEIVACVQVSFQGYARAISKANKTLRDFENLSTYFAKMSEFADENEIMPNVDFFAGATANRTQVEAFINNGIEQFVKDKITEIIFNHSIDKRGYGDLKKTLEQYTSKEKKYGSKDEKETRDFILKTLRDFVSLPDGSIDADPTVDKTKKLLIRTLIKELEKEEIIK